VRELLPARPSKVFDTYWRFAVERQEIFFRRFQGTPPPWTDDPILQTYKFTNAYRASDRVSQYLIRHVIYEGDQSCEEVFFRIVLFKLFNKIETWELLRAKLGSITHREYSYDRYDAILTNALEKRGDAIYSAAYIMPSGGQYFHASRKHRNHLRLIEYMMKNDLPQKISACPSMREAFELLRACPTIGDFLAYQFVTDVNYSSLTNFSEMSFVSPGPGARDGIHKCFAALGGLNEVEIIKLVADVQEAEFKRLGLTFRTLWGRRLQLIDCQNLFCEVGKYTRVSHPDIKGISDRIRIKQRFSPESASIDYWYPPKWDLNDKVAAEKKNSGRAKA